MSSVTYTLSSLRSLDRAIKSYKGIDHQKATVELVNGVNIVVFISEDYIFGVSQVMDAFESEPFPDYLVFNAWGHATDEAKVLAYKKGRKIISYGRFRHILRELCGIQDQDTMD